MIPSILQVTMIHGIMILTGIHRAGHSACPLVFLTWDSVFPLDGLITHPGIILTMAGIILITDGGIIHTGTDTTMDIMTGITDTITVVVAAIITIITPITVRYITGRGVPLKPTVLPLPMAVQLL
jgi:hypothetical protein